MKPFRRLNARRLPGALACTSRTNTALACAARLRATLPGAILALALALALASCASAPGSARTGADGAFAPAVPSTVRSFLDDNGWDLGSYSLSDLSDLGRYRAHLRRYEVAAGADELWAAYRRTPPAEAWTTPMTAFGAAWDPDRGALVEPPGHELAAFAPGQVFALELTVAGIARLPAAFRMSRIDDHSRVIEFVYLEKNKSNGMQCLSFRDIASMDGSPRCVIEHASWYSSGNAFRDRRLYAPFHARILDAFHRNVLARAGFRLLSIDGKAAR